MRVLVTGGRVFNDRAWLWAGLDHLHKLVPITQIIEGGAPGADIFAQEWGIRNIGFDNVKTVDAEWDKYARPGRKNPAGAIRNSKMADMRPDVVLACPGGPGTANMIEAARIRGLNVVMLEKMPVAQTKKATHEGVAFP
jgi:hypothetical protein